MQMAASLPADMARVKDTADEMTGVLLLNLGGPDCLDDVEPFLYNLFKDPEILTLPKGLQFLNKPIAWGIAKNRAPTSKIGYQAIGGGSPQLKTTLAQAKAVETSLLQMGVSAKCYVAMRYWNPYAREAIAAMKADGVKRLVILPLYPQYSISTSGSSLRELESILYEDEEFAEMRTTVIPAWYNRQGYVDAMASLIRAECDKFSSPGRPQLFFSAHGLPNKYIDELGDPYKAQMEKCVGYIMARLRELGYDNPHNLAYQSRVGPVQWLQPYTDDKIRELGESGVEDVVVIPISFVSEHIETLEEIDIEYRELAEECGIRNWRRVPALGLDQAFIDDLASAVMEALPKLDESPMTAINNGVPVSLKSMNNMVKLATKQELKLAMSDRISASAGNKAELINGRLAMASMGFAMLSLVEKSAGVVGTPSGTISDLLLDVLR